MTPRISIEPGKRSGQPCVRGLRITVCDVLTWLAGGMTEQEILEDYPDLEPDDLRAVYGYAARMGRQGSSFSTSIPTVNAIVKEALEELSPWVKYIGFDIAPDWDGDMSLYFRVLLTDKAASREMLRDIGRKAEWALGNRVGSAMLGLFPYLTFRSESELAAHPEPGWEYPGA